MLDEYKKLYEEIATAGLPEWKTINKNELIKTASYLENGYLKDSYVAAIMLNYWNKIGKFYSKCKLVTSPEDIHTWLTISVLYALDRKPWESENSSIYNDPNGPDKVINRCMECRRITFYQQLNRYNRKINSAILSLDSLVEDYKDQIGLTSLSIKSLGSALASDYKRRNEIFKHTALEESVASLEYAKTNGINDITLYNPYDFAFEYTTTALEVPYEATQYEIFDYSIPFYQLVVNGLFDYSGEVINATDEKGNMWHIMHILETGSNVAFTFSYEDSSKLIQTDYKNFYYTQYSKWSQDVADMLEVIDEIGIHGGELTSHERIANNVYRVTYKGATNVEIILNYSDAAVNVEGKLVAAKSYIYNKNNTEWWA